MDVRVCGRVSCSVGLIVAWLLYCDSWVKLYLTKYWWLIDLCMKPCIWVIIEGNYIYFTSIYFVYFAIIFRSLLSPSASAVLFVLCKSASWALQTTAYLLYKCEHVSIYLKALVYLDTVSQSWWLPTLMSVLNLTHFFVCKKASASIIF